MHLKIASLNLKGFGEWETRLPQILSLLQNKNPDIIVFQEVRFDPNISGGTALEMINKKMGYPYHQYAKCFNFGEDYGRGVLVNKETGKPDFVDEGLGVISKIPFSGSVVDLPIQKGSDRRPRIALKCKFDSFCLVNLHYSPSASASIQWQETPKEDIIIGDFNMKPLQIKEVQGIYNSSYDFKEYISYPSEGNTFDYCLLKNGNFKQIELVDGLSDHVALFFEIEI